MTVSSGYTWTGSAGDGNWTTPGNWNPSGPPTSGAAVTINGGTIDMGATTDTVDNLILGGNLLVGRFQGASLVVIGGTITNDLQIRSQGEVVLRGQINGGGEIDVESSSDSTANLKLGDGSLTDLTIDVDSDTGITIANGAKAQIFQSTITDTQSPITLGTNSTLRLSNTSLSSEGFAGPLDFTTGGSLILDQAAEANGMLVGGFDGGGNSIDLRGAVFGNLRSESLVNDGSYEALTLTFNHQTIQIDLIGQFAANFTTNPGPGYQGFVLSSDHTGTNPGTVISYVHS